MNQCKPVIYKNPKKITKLVFNNRLNTEYTVVKEPIENFDLGTNPTYKDYIKNALDPNIDSNANVYGIAKVLKPLTTRLNEMKQNIDNANAAYFDLKKRVQAQQEQEQQEPAKSPEQPAPASEAKGADNV